MRRFATLAIATVSAVALAIPTVATSSAVAAPGSGSAVSAPAEFKAKAGKIKVKRSAKGVQPGIGKEKVTAFVRGGGKVKFTLKGVGITKNKKVKAKKGKAVYKVPPLGTGDYKVKVSYQGKKGKTKFRVYASAVTLSATTFTFSDSSFTNRPALSGSVFFKDKPAKGGYFDVYLNGNLKGGSSSPDYLRFASVDDAGNFDFGTGFASAISTKYGPGTYTFQGFYTETPSYAEYIASQFITVVVTP